MTAPFIPTGPDRPLTPARVLSLEEFEQAQSMTPDELSAAKFPAAPPVRSTPSLRQAADATHAGIPEQNPQAYQLKGMPRILTQYIAEPLMDHPVMSAIAPLVPGAGYVFTGMMGKDILEYAAQKAAELSLPESERKLAETDPNRISGEQAAVEASLLGAVPFAQRVLRRIRGAPAGVSGAAAANAPSLPFEPVKVTPEAQSAVRAHVDRFTDAWRAIFAPASRSSEALEAANIFRATTGEMAGSYEQAAYRLNDFRRAIEPLSESDKLGFIDAIEGGRSQPTPEFAAGATALRETLDNLHQQIQSLGPGHLDGYLQNYFPHIWTDPARAAEAFKAARARASLEGPASFRQERVIPTTAEGLALGLEPVTTNPVDLTLLKVREMQRYYMAQQSLSQMKDAGLVKYVPAGELPPDGYARIDDRVATVFGPREGAVTLPEGSVKALAFDDTGALEHAEPLDPEDVSVQGLRIMGEHFAPEPVARVFNNYLSPGLRGNALYDAYRGLGNILNQAQLGLSAFHLGFTSMDATVSRTALGLEYLASGNPVQGLKHFVTAPAAPVPGIVQGTFGDFANWLLGSKIAIGKGAKIRAAYLDPSTASPDMIALANAVKEAGGRVRMDSFYHNSAIERMLTSWHAGEYGKATALSLPALLEATAKPIMEHIVPLQKLTVFGDLAEKVLGDLPADASLADRRAALAKAWDSVDNRMGQLVYDNLFWNKTVKDLSMASVRSVGWNIGTIRELGGGMADIAGSASDLAHGRSTELTHRAAYVIALPLVVGMYSALYQYLRTGQGPQEMKDYYFPRTGEIDANGNPERVQIASYMKDFFGYIGHPWETVKHKMAPFLSTVYEMLQNEDFYGDQIRNRNDPAVAQVAQEAKFILKQLTPFSIRNSQEASSRGDQSAVTKFGSWFGVTPAPRDKVRTDAQNRIADYLSERRLTGATPEDVEARRSRAEILAGLRGNHNIDLNQAVTDAIERHQLTAPDVVKLLKRAGTTPAQEQFKRLTLPQAIDVFKRSTPRERALFAEALLRKVERMRTATTDNPPTLNQ
jgi:hypothetical protein